jgi:O-methyltransferase
MKRKLGTLLGRLGLEVRRVNAMPAFPEATALDVEIMRSVAPYTLTSYERRWALVSAVHYVVRGNIEGDFVECGVWRGGSAMTMAKKLIHLGRTDRPIWLYDTFSGMTAPVEHDTETATGREAREMLMDESVRCVAGIEDVKSNLAGTGYPPELLRFVPGDVAQTLTQRVPERIALLRLDTDWYESTKVEMEVLFPRLVSGGVCIIDDYGHWDGARKAIDGYLAREHANVLLSRIDGTGRMFVKP